MVLGASFTNLNLLYHPENLTPHMPPTIAEKTWENCLTHICDQISTQSFRTWFAPITPLSLERKEDSAELRLAVPDAFHTEWLESHYAQVIRQAADDVVGRNTAISYEVAPDRIYKGAAPDDGAARRALDASVPPGDATNHPAWTQHRQTPPVAAQHGGQPSRPHRSTSQRFEAYPPPSATQAPTYFGSAASTQAFSSNGSPARTQAPPSNGGAANTQPSPSNGSFARMHPHQTPSSLRSSGRPPARDLDSRLKSEYTFDSFIEGDSNRLARSAAVAIAQNPGGTSFNPFMVYGGVGLGKTHIVQAIGNYVNAEQTSDRVLYVSSEQFTSQFVRSIQENRVSDFSNFYRQIDLLIVDDVQFFGGKEKTQEEFFHVFNELHQTGKQIILCADRPPSEISGIEERLLSRFKWGLSADIQPPDLETRIAILQHKAVQHNVSLTPDVVDFVAERVKANIRQLEGALLRLSAHAGLYRREIDPDAAKEILRDMMDDIQVRLEIEDIQRSVAQFYDITPELLSAKTRKREIVTARHVSMYFCKQLTSHSLKSIGLRFGGRDHSTVIHACNSVEDRLELEPAFREEVEEIQKGLERQSPPRSIRMRNQIGVA